MHVTIIGGGILGLTTAYFLLKQKVNVTIIDTHAEVAAECSHANGGQLSYSHVEPWANPHAFGLIARSFVDSNSPLIFCPRLDWQQWRWGAQFLWECRPGKHLYTTALMWHLAQESRQSIRTILQDTAIECDFREHGTLHVFRNHKSFAIEQKQAQYQELLGCPFEIKTTDECISLEPQLAERANDLVGGVLFPVDDTGDAYRFCQQLYDWCQQQGMKSIMGQSVVNWKTEENSRTKQVKAVRLADGSTHESDLFISCVGAKSNLLLATLGITLPLFPMKGYSLTYELPDNKRYFEHSITDEAHKIVFTQLGQHLRIAGTAEFNGFDETISPKRLQPIRRTTCQLFPSLMTAERLKTEQSWSCLRPSTPDGIPIIDRTLYENLYVNTGHGTLGWTLGPASSQRLVDWIINGKTAPGHNAMRIQRFALI
jgi:D-amino-acid dehydrogenase